MRVFKTLSRRQILLVLSLIALGGALFGVWYVPRKIRSLVLERIHRAARARGVQLESLDLDLTWSTITIRGIHFTGKGFRGTVDSIKVHSYNVTGFFPLRVQLGKVAVRNLGVEGELPQFSRREKLGASQRRITYDRVELDGLWLDLKTAYGKLSVEDGRGRYMPNGVGHFTLERISLASKRIPVYFVNSAQVRLSKGRQVERVHLEELVWKLSPEFRFFMKMATLEPLGGDRLKYNIQGRFLDRRGRVKAKGSYHRGTGLLTMHLNTQGARVGYLLDPRMPLKDREEITLDGDLHLQKRAGIITLKYRGTLGGVSLEHRLIAESPLRDLLFSLDFTARYDQKRDLLEVTSSRFAHKKIKGSATLQVRRLHSTPALTAHLVVPETPCQEVINSLPKPLFPNVSRFKMEGVFGADVTARVDFSQLNKRGVKLGGKIDLNRCRVRWAPPYFRATRIKRDFDFTILEPGGQSVVVSVDSEGESFTPLGEISPYMVQAVLTTEDGRFYRHKGFITSEFSSALAKNLAARRFKWGASSITMQIVKNVYLRRKKTLSRKFEELFLTWHVERFVPKRRLMEIYLNSIELGPNIYGVTNAAWHFFGKEPKALTPKEAIYFASVLPSPKKRYRYYCQGKISRYWNRYLNRLLRIMQRRRRLTSEEYEAAIQEEIQFDHTEFLGKWRCLSKIRHYSHRRSSSRLRRSARRHNASRRASQRQ